jgi:predicted nucleic acid-binding protein
VTGLPAAAAAAPPKRLAVVDTNVWLDLYFFGDPDARALAGALESPRWAAVRCAQTDAELAAVLQRPRFGSNAGERARLADSLRRWQLEAACVSLRPQGDCRCRDPDDQKFLDLAFAARAAALLTKDKALLSVRRRAARLGLAILTPRQFGDSEA